jgi:hypothetical protein
MIALTIAGGALAIFMISKFTKAAEPYHEKMGGAAAKILAARYGGKAGALGALAQAGRDREAMLPPAPSSEKQAQSYEKQASSSEKPSAGSAAVNGVPLLLPHEEKEGKR